MKRIVSVLTCLLLFGISAFAEPITLSPGEISAAKLKSVLSKQFETSINDDGMVIITNAGKNKDSIEIYIDIDPEDKVITFFDALTAKKALNELTVLKKMNDWNYAAKLSCAVYDAKLDAIFWQYKLVYSGGINTNHLFQTINVLMDEGKSFCKTFNDMVIPE